MKVLTFIGQIMIAIGIITLAIALFSYKGSLNRYLDLKAQHDCAQDYKLEYFDQKTGTTVIRPVEDLYQNCLNSKK